MELFNTHDERTSLAVAQWGPDVIVITIEQTYTINDDRFSDGTVSSITKAILSRDVAEMVAHTLFDYTIGACEKSL